MAKTFEFVLAALVVLLAACSRSSDSPALAPVSSAAGPKDAVASPVIAEANESVKKGAYDEAAAKLVELRASGHEFSNREAAEYRRALNDAYTRAMEAAERGDPRAKTALEMLRRVNQ